MAARMKRYRVIGMHWDTTANHLGMLDLKMEEKDWPQATKDMMTSNRDRLLSGLVAQYGQEHFDAKVANLKDIGMLPISVIAFHNDFLEQARHAFVMGFYYPSLAATCALGERVLNHLMLKLRDDFSHTPEYKDVRRKKQFDDWNVSIKTLSAWKVLVSKAAQTFQRLRLLRHQALHFTESTDTDTRGQALQAIRLFQEIVVEQFSTHGLQPWYLPEKPGAVSFVREDHQHHPFVKRVILPNCRLVGPDHELRLGLQGWDVIDHSPDDGTDGTDEEFLRLYDEAQVRRAERVGASQTSPPGVVQVATQSPTSPSAT
jgi:hypothetical protein